MTEYISNNKPPIPPRGTEDTFGLQLLKVEAAVELLSRSAKLWGFSRIDLPMFESEEVFRRTAEFSEETSYLFTDKSNRHLVLRPDINAPISRAIVNNFSSAPTPIKLFFTDKVFRYRSVSKDSKREFRIFGLETYGVAEASADAEILRVVADVIEEAGFPGYDIEFGNLQLYYKYIEEIVGKLQNPPGPKLLLHKLRFAKDISVATKILQDSAISGNDIEKMVTMLSSSGKGNEGLDILTEFSRYSKAIEDELESTLKFKAALEKQDLQNSAFSLGNLHGTGFYSGFTYRLAPKGASVPFIDGGRYDSMVENLGGLPTPATGIGVGIDRFISALEQQNLSFINLDTKKGAMIVFEDDALRTDLRLILKDVREKGITLEEELIKRKTVQTKRYGMTKGYKYLITITDNEGGYNVRVSPLAKREEEQTYIAIGKENLANILSAINA